VNPGGYAGRPDGEIVVPPEASGPGAGTGRERGDRVQFCGLIGTVLYIYGDYAQVQWDTGGITTTKAKQLTLLGP